MLKALLKKQFSELNKMYFMDTKTGKMRSKKAITVFIILFALVFMSVAFAFFGVSSAFIAFASINLDWLYFAMLGIMAVGLGVFGSVFNTFASLYLAKDNELLLSMPIPPSYILASRVSTVVITSLGYSALAWIPAIIVYASRGYMTFKVLISCIILQIIITLLVSALTCALGWVIARISLRLKNKSVITALLTVAFMGGYYFLQFKFNSILKDIALNGVKIAQALQKWAYPIYRMGLGATGDGKSLAIFSFGVIAVSVICYVILSRSFIGIITSNRGTKKAKYKEKAIKASSVGSALVRKELKRFVKSPTYLINGGMGIIILVAASIALIIKKDSLLLTLGQLPEEYGYIAKAIPVFMLSAVCLMVSWNAIAPPSVSLEGKNIWLLQSLPVDPQKILGAKKKIPVILNTVPAILFVSVASIAMKANAVYAVLAVIAAISYILFNASFGIAIGTRTANVVWTNEAIPIKQGTACFIMMFGGMLLSAAVSFGYILLNKIPVWIYLIALTALFAMLTVICDRWIKNNGTEYFMNL